VQSESVIRGLYSVMKYQDGKLTSPPLFLIVLPAKTTIALVLFVALLSRLARPR
jgi:hypothetical protein